MDALRNIEGRGAPVARVDAWWRCDIAPAPPHEAAEAGRWRGVGSETLLCVAHAASHVSNVCGVILRLFDDTISRSAVLTPAWRMRAGSAPRAPRWAGEPPPRPPANDAWRMIAAPAYGSVMLRPDKDASSRCSSNAYASDAISNSFFRTSQSSTCGLSKGNSLLLARHTSSICHLCA